MSIIVLPILQSGMHPRVKLWFTNVFFMYMQCTFSQRYVNWRVVFVITCLEQFMMNWFGCTHIIMLCCRYNPGVLQPRKWENAMTIDKGSWGYRRNADVGSYLTQFEMIKTLAETIR